MSNTQRATIFFLVVTVVTVWGLGLRAALRPGARANQELTVSPIIVDATAVIASAMTARPSATSTSSPEPTSPIPPPTTTRTSTRTVTASPTVTPSPSATPTARPSPSPSPTATSSRQATRTPSPTVTIPGVGRFLLVNQDEQVMYVYENGIEMRIIPVSTGRPVANAFTPAWRGNVGRYWGSGPFLNTNLWSDNMWYLFPGARGSILIHSVPYTWDGDLKIYDQPDALGAEPASHGCVRISPDDAQWLERWDPVGVPIEITAWSGEIGPPDESLYDWPQFR